MKLIYEIFGREDASEQIDCYSYFSHAVLKIKHV